MRDKKRQPRRGKQVWILKDPSRAWPDALQNGPLTEGAEAMEQEMDAGEGPDKIVAGEPTDGAAAMDVQVVLDGHAEANERSSLDLISAYEPLTLQGNIAESILSPCLVIRMDKVRQNAERLVEMLGPNTMRWRFQTKESKSPSVWAEVI